MSTRSNKSPKKSLHSLDVDTPSPSPPPDLSLLPGPDEVVTAIALALRSPHLRRLAWRLQLNEDDLAEVVQNAVVRALQNLYRFDPKRLLLNWVAVILRNCMYDRKRSGWRRMQCSLFDRSGNLSHEPADCSPDPIDALIAEETQARLAAVLGGASRRVRLVAELRLRGLSSQETADQLGISYNAATGAWHRFSGMVRERLG